MMVYFPCLEWCSIYGRYSVNLVDVSGRMSEGMNSPVTCIIKMAFKALPTLPLQLCLSFNPLNPSIAFLPLGFSVAVPSVSNSLLFTLSWKVPSHHSGLSLVISSSGRPSLPFPLHLNQVLLFFLIAFFLLPSGPEHNLYLFDFSLGRCPSLPLADWLGGARPCLLNSLLYAQRLAEVRAQRRPCINIHQVNRYI